MASVDTKGIVKMFIGIFVLFVIVNAIYGTVNQSVTDLNDTMTAAGNPTEGNLVVRGWQILQLVLGVGAILLGAKELQKRAG